MRTPMIGRGALALLLSGCAWTQAVDPLENASQAPQARRTIENNLQFRFSWGDLGNIVLGTEQSKRGVQIEEGGEQILESCILNSSPWRRDPLIARFGHTHPFATIGCRERTSPGLHVVFYRDPDGDRQAWAHFDLHGPQSKLAHLSEVARNRLSFGRTSEFEVYRGLLREDPVQIDSRPAPRYDQREHLQQYVRSVFGRGALAFATLSALDGSALHQIYGPGPAAAGGYGDRLAANLARNGVARSIQFGSAAFLEQDQRFTRSGKQGFRKRTLYAVSRMVVVSGREGNELAFPRLASAFGTALVAEHWHPWQAQAPDPWVQAGTMLGRDLLQSVWKEFKPEIVRGLRGHFRRDF